MQASGNVPSYDSKSLIVASAFVNEEKWKFANFRNKSYSSSTLASLDSDSILTYALVLDLSVYPFQLSH